MAMANVREIHLVKAPPTSVAPTAPYDLNLIDSTMAKTFIRQAYFFDAPKTRLSSDFWISALVKTLSHYRFTTGTVIRKSPTRLVLCENDRGCHLEFADFPNLTMKDMKQANFTAKVVPDALYPVLSQFTKDWAAAARGESPETFKPFTRDPSVLKVPSHIHAAQVKPASASVSAPAAAPPMATLEPILEDFYVLPSSMKALKAFVNTLPLPEGPMKHVASQVSASDCLSALLWWSIAQASNARTLKTRTIFGSPVNLRSLKKPLVQMDYSGNAWLSMHERTCNFQIDDLIGHGEDGIRMGACAIRHGICELTEDYLNGYMKNFRPATPDPSIMGFFFTSWRGFDLYDADFGFGKPIGFIPVHAKSPYVYISYILPMAPHLGGESGAAFQLFLAPDELERLKANPVGTLGPGSVSKLRELFLAGLNVVRLNFSHISDPESQTPIIHQIRSIAAELHLAIAILGDLGGPKIRCNAFKGAPSIQVVTGTNVLLRSTLELGEPGIITTDIHQIVRNLQPGHRVLLDDGNIAMKMVSRTNDDEIVCHVTAGGELKPRKGINVPDLKIPLPALTEKDKRDAKYMYKMRLDYVALRRYNLILYLIIYPLSSFVQRPEDVQDLLDLFTECHKEELVRLKAEALASGVEEPMRTVEEDNEIEEDWRPHIISKIEKPQALDQIDDIIRITDGIMVARGDLGVECSLEQVPVLQKMLIRKTNQAEKPVITATQMLESMVHAPVPTRAEVSDVANAVFDGTDAVMLSAEMATGDFPVETVAMTNSLTLAPPIVTDKGAVSARRKLPSEFAHAIADAATDAGREGDVKAMIIFTTSGDMAIYCSKRRPTYALLAVTPTASIFRRLNLLYGVLPVLSSAMRVKRVGVHGISKLKEELSTSSNGRDSPLPWDRHSPTSPTQAVGDPYRPPSPERGGGMGKMVSIPLTRNTDTIYSQTEKDVIASPSGQSIGLKTGDKIVFAAGYHSPYPGLSNTIKMARFGEAVRSEKTRAMWSQAATKLVAQQRKSSMTEELAGSPS
ncbi:pyruvate kinase [Synchytrium microbalum]|uniref:pyruvate kinase n=1 Tax=Synchytrium microbalum TaxID=1806994 RepID=A0A507C0I2_9FUNG|nr:pyruvate kinase [Synchytrium microbalum]TPX33192.1 pyruvate kinase [Synchytrium microbalum]